MKKINFSDKYQLTQAVLEGKKTMTRRPVRGAVPLGNWAETVSYSPYKVGEIVAVAQRYRDIMGERGEYGVSPLVAKAGYLNKMFVKAELMPHRIMITDVRIERVRSISSEECLLEGVERDNKGYYFVGKHSLSVGRGFAQTSIFPNPRKAFAALIDKTSGKGTWEKNPYVWVYSFKLIK